MRNIQQAFCCVVVAVSAWLGSGMPGTATEGADKVAGRVYYVDAVTGNDTRTGTDPTSAWKSLAKVNAATFLPGDSILFKSGSVWTGQLTPKGSGSDQHPIRIGKYGSGPSPAIRGDATTEDVVLLKNQEYWEIQDLDLSNIGDGAKPRRAVHVVAADFGDMHHIYLRSLTIHDVNGVDSDKVNGGINYSAAGDARPSRFVDLRIENNRIEHVDRSGIFGWSSHWPRAKWYPSLGVVIRNNTLNDIGGDGIVVVATDGALVEGNVVSRANQRSEGFNVAIWAWSADNTLIQHNEAYLTHGYRDGEGFDSDWNSHNTVIQYNYSHDNDGGFLLICNDGGQKAEENAGNLGTVVRYNISQNDRSRGINVSGPVSGASVYNNTIFTSSDRDVDLILYSDWGGWPHDTSFFNNVFYVGGTAKISYGVSRHADGSYASMPGFGPSTGNTFDSNAYFGKMTPPDDPHALIVDPRLLGPGTATAGRASAEGYKTREDSPLINSGKSISESGGQDFWGRAVPSCGRTDRGAAEFDRCGELGQGK